jgi:hypothetical protein
LALQEILLAGCPTVGVRTGAAFVEHAVTGMLVDRLPPGRQCIARDDDASALATYLDALHRAQSLDRQAVRAHAASTFATVRIVDQVIEALDVARTCPAAD